MTTFFKVEQDTRITKVGAILRKLSIDEIPQLLNVLKGEMSIVGPRPEVPTITNAYNNLQARRLEVKPGLTGLAQINGRSNISHGQKNFI
ncbi:sugar transferase [Lysinibacillus sp. MHQ-1]|nr:sugar transferase [Lysinibacillus sp. MHQ-1]